MRIHILNLVSNVIVVILSLMVIAVSLILYRKTILIIVISRPETIGIISIIGMSS
jgi:uncharacterized membrane protein